MIIPDVPLLKAIGYIIACAFIITSVVRTLPGKKRWKVLQVGIVSVLIGALSFLSMQSAATAVQTVALWCLWTLLLFSAAVSGYDLFRPVFRKVIKAMPGVLSRGNYPAPQQHPLPKPEKEKPDQLSSNP